MWLAKDIPIVVLLILALWTNEFADHWSKRCNLDNRASLSPLAKRASFLPRSFLAHLSFWGSTFGGGSSILQAPGMFGNHTKFFGLRLQVHSVYSLWARDPAMELQERSRFYFPPDA